MELEKVLPNSFCESSIIPISKPDEGTRRKGDCNLIFLINYIFRKVLVNIVQNI
jgi:hypothetical protein